MAPSSGAAATVRLPDPRRSYAVLIGSSRYRSAELSDLPAVAGNLAGLAEVLTDPALGGFPPDRCIVVPDPASAPAARRMLREYAALAEDTLLVYWAGHGGPGPGGEFHLSMTGAPGSPPASALAAGHIREAMLRSPAAHRILILDCCFSGRVVPVTGVTGSPLIKRKRAPSSQPRPSLRLAATLRMCVWSWSKRRHGSPWSLRSLRDSVYAR